MKRSMILMSVHGLRVMVAGLVLGMCSLTPLWAHCDTAGGPVIPEAKAALEKGDVTPLLKWIKPEYEAEIKTAFSDSLKVRSGSPEAKALADKYFLETLVRLHRAGEGAPYTGIKEDQPEKIVLLADEALSEGSAKKMIGKMQKHIEKGIREKFDKVLKASKDKDASVEKGREYVEAYVEYMHYVEGIHAAVMPEGGHHGGAKACGKHEKHAGHKE